MPLLRPCSTCGALSRGTRCPTHARMAERSRVARRGSLYDRQHRNRAHAQIAAEPWCDLCGSDLDLTADHIVPGDRESPLRTLCRSCNSIRANRARWQGAGGAA